MALKPLAGYEESMDTLQTDRETNTALYSKDYKKDNFFNDLFSSTQPQEERVNLWHPLWIA